MSGVRCLRECRHSRGYVLLPVAVIIGLVAASAYLITRESAMNVKLAVGEGETTMVRYAAEAGFQHANWQAQGAGCSGYVDVAKTPFGEFTYSATVAPNGGSPIAITATATSADGVTSIVSREAVQVYQSSVNSLVLQNNAIVGKDAWIESKKSAQNYGAHRNLDVGSSGVRSLLEFNLSRIPDRVHIVFAQLELYNGSVKTGTVSVHSITTPWVEGTCTTPACTADGATWDTADGTRPWGSPGADHVSTPAASLGVQANQWNVWDITTLVSAWSQGALPNYGMLLKTSDAKSISFVSSDNSNATLHPKLTILYACECGSSCGVTDSIILSTKTPATLGGLSFMENDLAEYDPRADTATLFFDGSATTLLENIDAVHVLGNGHLLLSTGVGATLGGLSFGADDLIDYDPVADSSAMVFDGGALFGATDENIDAVHVLDNGRLILSTNASATLGGLTFGANDLVDYDLATDTASLFFDGSVLFGGGGEDIDGVHILDDGHLILSDANDGALLGGLAYNDDDLVDYDPVAGTANLYFNGSARFQQTTQNVMSAYIGAGSGSVACGGNFQDRFDTAVFSNSDGSRAWSGDWIEIDSAGAGPTAGKVQITNGELHMNGTPPSVDDPSLARQMDLTGYLSATLSFTFGTGAGVDLGEDSVVVEVSDNGGSFWIVLENFIDVGPSATGTRSYDITRYIAENTQVRFRINNNYGGPDEFFYVDNVAIDASCNPLPACDADYVPDTKLNEFYGGVEVEFASGLTFLPEGKIFKGVNVPVGGAWIVANDGQNTLDMRDSNSNQLASCNLGLLWTDGLTGVSWVQAGTWADHLAISVNGSFGSSDYVAILDFDCNQRFTFDTQALGSFAPSDVTYIGKTTSGNYDDHLAISDPAADQIFIVDQAGSLQVSRNVSGFATSIQGLAHLPGTDKLLLTDYASMSAYRFDFELLTVDPGYALSGYGITSPTAVAVNPLTCDHVHVDDFDGTKFMVLNLGGGGGPACDGNFRDEFNNVSYAGSNGTLTWATDWLEINEIDGPGAGDEQIRRDGMMGSAYSLRIRDNDGGGEGVQREVDLSGAGSASLSLFYRRSGLDNLNDYVGLEISANGAAGPWMEIDRYEGAATDPVYRQINYDISSYISANTRLRLLTSSSMGNTDTVWFDDIEIQCLP